MGNFFAELKRRHIYRVAAAYAVVAWVLLQLVNNLAPGLNLPNWALTFVIVLLAVGFPIALIFAWTLELKSPGASAERAASGKADWILSGALALVIALILYQQFAPTQATRTAQANIATAGSAAPSGGISLAVLPFVNLSDDRAQEFFSDGMTEEINAALAKVPDLIVIGRTSAFQFKGQNKDLRAIGKELGASHLIEGSVRKAGDRVRITAQLVRTDNGAQLWSENYDRQLTDIFAIQEDIAQAITSALRVPLGLQQGERLVSNRTADLDSYQQFLHAKALVRARAVDEAIAILEPAVAHDPSFAPSWAELGRAYELVPYYSPASRIASTEEARRTLLSFLDKAEKAVREAIRLDSGEARGYMGLAGIQTVRGNWSASEDSSRHALMLDPNDPDPLHGYSQFLAIVGRLKESVAMRDRLRTLEPFVPIFNIVTASIMQLNGQIAASIPILEATPPDSPVSLARNTFLARGYAASGRYADAAETLLASRGNLVSRRTVEDAARLIRTAPAKGKSSEALPFLEGEPSFVYGYVGALDRVLEFPEHTVALGYFVTTSLYPLWDSQYAPLRKTARFKALMRKAGLVDYWRERGWPDLCHPTTADDFECN